MEIRGGVWSEIGHRKVNQDAVLYRQLIQGRHCFALGMVCDGVGGLERGEMASAFLAEKAESWFGEIANWLDIAQCETDILYSHLKDAVESWNEELCLVCRETGVRSGSTMSLLMLVRDRYYVVHVGDSRIYRFRNGMEQLTMDASVARMKNGHMKNYLENYMGKKEELSFQAVEGMVQEGDMFLVCSDGLYHELKEEDAEALAQGCAEGEEMGKLCEKAVKWMLARGERDNLSLCLISVCLSSPQQSGQAAGS